MPESHDSFENFDKKKYSALLMARQTELNHAAMQVSVSGTTGYGLMFITGAITTALALLHPLLAGVLIAPWTLIIAHFCFKAGTLKGAEYGFYMGSLAPIPAALVTDTNNKVNELLTKMREVV